MVVLAAPTLSGAAAPAVTVDAVGLFDLIGVAVGLVIGLALAVVVAVGQRRSAMNRQTAREAMLTAGLEERRADLERREARLSEREAALEGRAEHVESRAAELEHRLADLETRAGEVARAEEDRHALLEQTALLSSEQARAEIVAGIEHEARLHAAALAREIEQTAREEAESRARRVLSTVVQRLAAQHTAESTVTVVPLASDDLKGRVIGREGRNIRAFEAITGVSVVIDDTPSAIVLSCFDPVRRETGRVTMESLVGDGRIHPTRIEEAFAAASKQVEEECLRAGRDACLEMGITDLHPELVLTMGKLRFRTSYGQNVLGHLIESGHAAGLLAAELGLDRALCVRAAFLHDIGKALTHETEGSHALVGADLARRFGEAEDVVHAIEAHHNEVEPRTVEAIITQAADAISGSRPGARRESVEVYTKRMRRLEEIALSKPGVDRVFAMQAGRDVRVMVLPEEVDDLGAQLLARDIAKQYEEELTYPGQIKVTVIRESRATETAR